MLCFVCVEVDGDHRDLHVQTHAFPTRRSSELWTVQRWSAAGGHVCAPAARRPFPPSMMQSCGAHPAGRQILTHCLPGGRALAPAEGEVRSEEHTSELQSLMRLSYAVFCLKKKNN